MSVSYVSVFVIGMISIPGLYRDNKFYSGKVVFLDNVLVNARDICATINQCLGVDDFYQMQRNYKLDGDLH